MSLSLSTELKVNSIITQDVSNSSSFINLIKHSRLPESNFQSVSEQFAHLQQQCNYKYTYDYTIPDSKGALFSKVVEIKAQQAHHFVDEIQHCDFKQVMKSGFTREIIINIPEAPSFEERIYIEKIANGEIKAYFVQTDGKDDFACLNHVYLDGGEWHWSGTYLYGVPKKNLEQMFSLTFTEMLKFLDDTSKFNQVYESLHKW